MNPDTAIQLALDALAVTVRVSAPVLLVSLGVGLVVSIFQAVTQIQEMTLSFIPKIIAIGAVIALAGPWMLDEMLAYARELLTSIPTLAGP